MAEVARLKEEAPALDAAADAAGKALAERLAAIPNLPGADVPEGRDEHDNVEKSRFEGRGLAQEGRQHFELGEATGLMDFEAAAKALRLALRGAQGPARPAGAGARPVHARPAHGRARLHRE